MAVEITNPVKIDRLILRPDGKTVELYSGRLNGYVLRLFNAAELVTVNIDPASLTPGQITPCLLLAHWQPSPTGKLNSKGNVHKDLIRLESLIPAATGDNAPLMREIAARLEKQERMIVEIGKMVREIYNRQPGAELPFDYFYGDGTLAEAPEDKNLFNMFRRAHEGKAPESLAAAMKWSDTLKHPKPPAGKPATRTGRPLQAQMN